MSRRFGAALVALGCATAALLAPGMASAYCRTRTCDPSRDSCDFDRNLCITSGDALYWPSACVTVSVQELGSPRHGIGAEDAERVAQRAFDAWLGADCGGGERPSITVQPAERTRCNDAEYNTEGGNANILIFRDDDWPSHSVHALALTTVWFDPESGRIYDVDVEVNGTAGPLTTTTPEAGADLQSILTHEFGHFLGLSHSEVSNSVMRKFYDSGSDDLRTLHADDQAGICDVYPANRVITRTDCTPRHGFSTECDGGDAAQRACALVTGAGSDGGSDRAALVSLGALALGLTLTFTRARRRRRPTDG